MREQSNLGLPGLFEPFILSRPMTRAPSHFIHSMHPKTEILPDPATIRRILDRGWWGQVKMNGHRAQFHISNDSQQEIISYNRTGGRHARPLPAEVSADLRRIFGSPDGWNAIDAEWVKAEQKIYVFDYLKFHGKILMTNTYEERHSMLPRLYKSEFIETLPVLTTVDQCLKVIDNPANRVEGLVFKSRHSVGFEDTSIIRCRIKNS